MDDTSVDVQMAEIIQALSMHTWEKSLHISRVPMSKLWVIYEL